MDGSRTHDGSYRPDTDFEDQEAHRDFTIPAKRIIQNHSPCNPPHYISEDSLLKLAIDLT